MQDHQHRVVGRRNLRTKHATERARRPGQLNDRTEEKDRPEEKDGGAADLSVRGAPVESSAGRRSAIPV